MLAAPSRRAERAPISRPFAAGPATAPVSVYPPPTRAVEPPQAFSQAVHSATPTTTTITAHARQTPSRLLDTPPLGVQRPRLLLLRLLDRQIRRCGVDHLPHGLHR